MIHATRLTKRFGNHLAVADLDLDVAKGEVFGLLGPNGAGKTTTVRMLTALIAPTSGTATLAGHALATAAPAIRANVGVLTETPGLYDRLTAAENLRFFGRLHAVPDLERRLRQYLDLLGLAERQHDLVGGFSKGMRQKLAIARALLHEPPVLFLDEPTSGLDPTAAKVVRDFIASLRADGRTIVLCTHNLDEAERLCDRIAIMRCSILQIGAPAELRAAHATPRLVLRTGLLLPEQVTALRERLGAAQVDLGLRGLTLSTTTPDTDAPALVRLAVSLDIDVLGLDLQRASLEEVYFALTGASSSPASEDRP